MDFIELSYQKPTGYIKFIAPIVPGLSAKDDVFSLPAVELNALLNSILKEQLGGGPVARATEIDAKKGIIHFTTAVAAPTVQDWAEKKSGIKSVPQQPGVEDYLSMLPAAGVDLIHPLQVAILLGGEHDPEDLLSYDALGLRYRDVRCGCGLSQVVCAEIKGRNSETPYLEVHIDAGTSVPIYMDGDLENFAATLTSFLDHLHRVNH